MLYKFDVIQHLKKQDMKILTTIITAALIFQTFVSLSQNIADYTTKTSKVLQIDKKSSKTISEIDKNYNNLIIRFENFDIGKGLGKILVLDNDREQYFKFTISNLINGSEFTLDDGSKLTAFNYLAYSNNSPSYITLCIDKTTKLPRILLIEINSSDDITKIQQYYDNLIKIN
jgi:hypothetical protein